MRLEKQRWLPVLLALIAAAVLLAGILTGSKTDSVTVPEITISAAELKGVRELAESNSLAAFRDRLNLVAEQVGGSLAWSDQWRRTGVMWREGEVLIARSPLDPQRTQQLRLGGVSANANPLQWAPGLPFANVGFQAEKALVPRRGDLDGIVPGTSVVAVTLRDRQRLLLPATLSGVVAGECQGWNVNIVHLSQVMPDEFVGGGLFTLQGELIGVVTDCGEGVVVLALRSVARVLDQLRTVQGRLLSAYGAVLIPPTPQLAEHFKVEDGVLVDSVWDQWPAARAELMPGDFIVAVGETKVATLEQLMDLRGAIDEGAKLMIRRGAARRTVTLPQAEWTPAGFELSQPGQEPVITEVGRGSREYAAGLRSGDGLVQAYGPGGKPVDVRSLARMESPAALYIVVRRAGRLQGIFLTP